MRLYGGELVPSLLHRFEDLRNLFAHAQLLLPTEQWLGPGVGLGRALLSDATLEVDERGLKDLLVLFRHGDAGHDSVLLVLHYKLDRSPELAESLYVALGERCHDDVPTTLRFE